MELDPSAIIATAARLRDRILERFPDASLGGLAKQVLRVAESAANQAEALRRPNLPLRAATILLVAALPAMAVLLIRKIDLHVDIKDLEELVPFLQAGIETLIFIGVGIAFLVTLEARRKRARALAAVSELRMLAHLIDMHQLDKDPVYLLGGGERTASSPERTMTAFELNRYFDYCCELLSLLGKLAALYGQQLSDPVAVNAIDQIEQLTTNLSGKIWQKTMLLPRATGAE